MTRRLITAALVASAVLAIGASAHAGRSSATVLFLERVSTISGPIFVADVTAEIDVAQAVRKCTRGRKVILYFKRGGNFHVRDVDRSSRNGAIALEGHARGRPDRLVLKVTKKHVEWRGRSLTCQAAHGGVTLQ